MAGIYRAWLKIDGKDFFVDVAAKSFDKCRQSLLKDGYNLENLYWIIGPSKKVIYNHKKRKIIRV